MAHDWDQHHAHAPHGHEGGAGTSAAELAGFLAGATERPRRALDLGCGTGADAVFLAGEGVEVTGIDASATALEHARRRAEQQGVRVTWLHGDALQVPVEDASMDLALDHGFLHHVATGDRARYAAEASRVLRAGGTLLIRERNHPGHHSHAVSETDIRAMFDGTPLRVRAIVSYGGEAGGRTNLLAVLVRD